MRPVLARALAPEVPVIVFANEFFDALPVEVLSSQGELHISEQDGRLLETWNSAPRRSTGVSRPLQRASRSRRTNRSSPDRATLHVPDRGHGEARIRHRHRLRLHSAGATCGTSPRHHRCISPALSQRESLRSAGRAGHHRARELHRAGRRGRAQAECKSSPC